MFTWGSFFQQVGNVLPYVLVSLITLVLGYFFGVAMSKSRVMQWLRTHKEERVIKLETKLALLTADMEACKKSATALSIKLRAARVLSQKVVELLS